MNYRLIAQILNEPFLIDRDVALSYGGLLLSIIKGEKISDQDWGKNRAENKAYIIGADSQDVYYDYNDANIPEGSTAVIPIRGEIMKYSEMCGPKGSLELTSNIIDADNNPNISGILLIIDSPGGQVTHTDLLAAAIKNAKTPTVAFVEGMAASAAYWIASSANKIIASSDIDKVGSIGTMMFYADVQPYYEEMGVKFHEIYATLSKDKNKDFNDVLAGKYDNYRTGTLDVINKKFHDAVRTNRPGISKDVFSGNTYFSNDAIELGLIDEIGTITDAFSALDGLKNKSDNQNKSNMKIKFLEKWAAIASFFSFDTSKENELTEESIDKLNDELTARQLSIDSLTQERDTAASQLETLNADILARATELETANARITELETDLSTANTAKETAVAELATATARITELEAENAALVAGPGAESAAAKSKTEVAAVANDESDMEYLRTHTVAEGIAYMNAKNKTE